jgi:hypothetical protein
MLAQRPHITGESALSWLQVIPYGDPGFAAKLGAAVKPETSTRLTKVLPYSLLVTNAGDVALSGIAIRFAVTTAGKEVDRDTTAGKEVDRDFFYHS